MVRNRIGLGVMMNSSSLVSGGQSSVSPCLFGISGMGAILGSPRLMSQVAYELPTPDPLYARNSTPEYTPPMGHTVGTPGQSRQ